MSSDVPVNSGRNSHAAVTYLFVFDCPFRAPLARNIYTYWMGAKISNQGFGRSKLLAEGRSWTYYSWLGLYINALWLALLMLQLPFFCDSEKRRPFLVLEYRIDPLYYIPPQQCPLTSLKAILTQIIAIRAHSRNHLSV